MFARPDLIARAGRHWKRGGGEKEEGGGEGGGPSLVSGSDCRFSCFHASVVWLPRDPVVLFPFSFFF